MFQAMIVDTAHVSLLRSDESLEVDWFYKHYVACIYGTRENALSGRATLVSGTVAAVRAGDMPGV